MLQTTPAFPFAFAVTLCAVGILSLIAMGHHDPLRLAMAGLGGAGLGLAVRPVLARPGKQEMRNGG